MESYKLLKPPIVLKIIITFYIITTTNAQQNNNNYYTYNTNNHQTTPSISSPWILLSSPLTPTTPPPEILLSAVSPTAQTTGFNWILTECSRTCGGGVRKLEFKCSGENCPTQPTNTQSSSPSLGPFYTSCNPHPCPGTTESISFRSTQCSHFDSVLFEGRYYSWIPYTKSNDKCELNCMPRGERFYYRHRKRVVDGTECDEEKGTSGGICVEGVCVPLGCDLLLGSSTREDSCRVCGGNNLNCHTVTGTFNDVNLQVGYNDVLLIPKGATNVEIREIEPSNNYLALRNLSSHFYLNGNWRIDFPRELNFAGTTWHYERKQPGFYSPESVKALGPTNEGIYVVLLYQEPLTSGLSYTYSVPKDTVSITSTSTYYWVAGDWSQCSVTCGRGIKVRSVMCLSRESGRNVGEELCDREEQPRREEWCGGETRCPVSWSTTSWSHCNASCNSIGLQYRHVYCSQVNDGVTNILDDGYCDGPRPEEFQRCRGPEVCPQWFIGEWSECPSLCGSSTLTRQVLCHLNTSTSIDIYPDHNCPSPKPPTSTPCSAPYPCTGLDWFTSPWQGCTECGQKTQRRNVFCGDKDGNRNSNENLCDKQRRPQEEKECEEISDGEKKCQFAWWAKQWGECSSPCTPGGLQSREVFCGETKPDGSIIKVNDSNCDELKKYNSTRPCEFEEDKKPNCTQGQWWTGPWGKCTKCSTTTGQKSRLLLCILGNTTVDVSLCGSEGIPETLTDCQDCEGGEITSTVPPEIDYDEVECEEVEIVEEEEEDLGSGGFQFGVENVEASGDNIGVSDLIDLEESSGSGDGGSGDEMNTPISNRRKRQENGDEENEDEDADSEYDVENGEEISTTMINGVESTTTIGPNIYDDDDDYGTGSGEAITAEGRVDYGDISSSSSTTEAVSGGTSTTTMGPEIITSTSGSTTLVPEITSTDSTTTMGQEELTMSTTTMVPSSESDSTTTTPMMIIDSTEHLTTTEESSTTTPSSDSTTTMATEGMVSTEVTTVASDGESTTEISDTMSTTTTSSETMATTTMISSSTTEAESTTIEPTTSTTPEDLIASTTTSEPMTSTTPDSSTSTTPEPPFTLTRTVCKPKHERKINCSETEFGCCPNGKDKANGPFWEGCPLPLNCNSTKYGCCHDGITISLGPNYYGCKSTCSLTIYGCCPDGFTPKTSNSGTECPSPCEVSKYGCCNGTLVPSPGPNQRGCQDVIPCEMTKFGCCPKGEVRAKGVDFKGCKEIDLKDCTKSWFGCCSDNKTAALNPHYLNCPPPCTYSIYGCCPNDTTTTPHGPNKEGCCINTEYGCCQDNIQPASGPNYLNCSCESSPYGCCPDNVTFASSTGCGCKFSEGGCCEDGWTERKNGTGDIEDEELDEGCPCYSYKFGCCPDGVRRAKGKSFEGCGCEYTPNGCCPDGRTPKPSDSECTCESSLYGCCPDGFTEATGEDFQGCEVKPVKPGDICHLERQRGPCRNFTVKWFFDMEYGWCSRFWFGGCEGNGNRFNSQDECKGVCVEPEGRDSCYLPLVPGPCEGYYPSYYYSPVHARCLQFVYRGCLGNNNRFQTLSDCENKCSLEAHVNPCNQPKVEGPCQGNYTKYYFDGSENDCKEFVYGGCKGGSNSFGTKRECEWRCKEMKEGKEIDLVRASCLYPPSPGHCHEKISNWHYDRTTSRCVPFYYTGCGGNNNRFSTREDCEKTCPGELLKEYYKKEEILEPDTDYRITTCTQPPVTGNCASYTERYYYDVYSSNCKPFVYSGCGGNNNNFVDIEECVNLCGGPRRENLDDVGLDLWEFKAEFCFESLIECQGSSVWGYDSSDGVCKEYFGGGCPSTNSRNKFRTREECEVRCDGVQDPCTLPPLTGPCSSSFPQYYYDPDSDQCTLFSYSGCQGNANRFDNLNLCEARCKRGETTTILTGQSDPRPPTENENENEIDVCLDPQDPGPCRGNMPMYYFNTYSQRCEMFIYVGCGGNGNRFEGVNECEMRCLKRAEEASQLCPPSNCETLTQSQCPYGLSRHYLSHGSSCIVCECFEPCANLRCPGGQECGVSRDEQSGRFVGECRDATKPGTCPGYDHFLNQTTCPSPTPAQCSLDSFCPSTQKCCYSPPCLTYICQSPVMPAPKLDYEPKDQLIIVPEGGLGKFRCEVIEGQGEVKWRINGDRVEMFKRARVVEYEAYEEENGGGSGLEIIGVRAEDEGLDIWCGVESGGGKVVEMRWAVSVGAPLPPSTASILPLPSTPLPPATLGSPYTLHCYALGYPHPQITWWRENKMLPSISEKYSYNKTDPELLIRIVQIRDLGPYTCQAYNGEGRAPSQTMDLVAWDEVQGNVVVDQEDRVTFGRWLVPKTHVSPPRRPSSGGVEIVTESAIITQPEVDTTTVMTSPDEYAPLTLRITLDPPYPPYYESTPITLTCHTSNTDPSTTILWYKSSTRVTTGPTLTIYNAKTTDSGRYTCLATNNYERNQAEIDIFIQPNVQFEEDTTTTTAKFPETSFPSLHPNCTDNAFFAKCDLIVKAKYCNNKYYARFCCKSCTVDGQLGVEGEHLRSVGERWFRGGQGQGRGVDDIMGKETNLEHQRGRQQELRSGNRERFYWGSSGSNNTPVGENAQVRSRDRDTEQHNDFYNSNQV